MTIIVNRYENSITGSVDGKPFGVGFSEERYATMKELEAKQHTVETLDELKTLVEEFLPLTQESYKEIVETACPYIGVNKATEKYYLKFDDGSFDNKAIPQPLVDRILKSVEMKIDVMPLVKFWTRFRRNPNFSEVKGRRLANYINKTYLNVDSYNKLIEQGLSDVVARERATTFQTPITMEGLLVTYKVSREKFTKFALDADGNKTVVDRYPKEIDEETGLITYKEPDFVEDRVYEPAVQGVSGDAFFCSQLQGTPKEGHVIKVGCRHWLASWDMVNIEDSRSCVKGLHAGNLDYIRGYQHDTTVTHNVFIDPMHVGAITDDGSGALRVKEYFVYSSFQGVNRSIYHSSTYASVTDEEFRAQLEEIQKKLQAETAEVVDRNHDEEAIQKNLAK